MKNHKRRCDATETVLDYLDCRIPNTPLKRRPKGNSAVLASMRAGIQVHVQ